MKGRMIIAILLLFALLQMSYIQRLKQEQEINRQVITAQVLPFQVANQATITKPY